MNKPRLFIVGDSWAYNYFDKPFLSSTCVQTFSRYYDGFGHWINHMEYFFNVTSFARGGASNEEIIYQLGNLPEYEPNDRLVIIFGPPGRFTWIENKKSTGTWLIEHEEFYQKQYVDRYDYWMEDFVENNQKSFISKIPILFKDYKPLMFTWVKEISDKIKSIEYIDTNEKFTTIKEESGDLCNDTHLGVGGNFELFKLIANRLNLDISEYKFEIKEYKKEFL